MTRPIWKPLTKWLNTAHTVQKTGLGVRIENPGHPARHVVLVGGQAQGLRVAGDLRCVVIVTVLDSEAHAFGDGLAHFLSTYPGAQELSTRTHRTPLMQYL